MGSRDPEGRWLPEYDYQRRKLSQEVGARYTENGGLYVLWREVLETYGNRLGGEVYALLMDWYQSVDIDLPEDLATAERLLRAWGPPA